MVPGVSYVREKGLKEWNYGTFEGLSEDTNPPLPYGDFYVPFGGEGEMEFRARWAPLIALWIARITNACWP